MNENAQYTIDLFAREFTQPLAIQLGNTLRKRGYRVRLNNQELEQVALALQQLSQSKNRDPSNGISQVIDWPAQNQIIYNPANQNQAVDIVKRLSYIADRSDAEQQTDLLQWVDHPTQPIDNNQLIVYLPDGLPAGGLIRDPLINPYQAPVVAAMESKPVVTVLEPKMVAIPAGVFVMGSPQGEVWRDEDEGPQHEVRIQSFYMSETEVTFTQYDQFATATGREKPHDSGWGRGKRPVINVSWEDAQAYVQWLSQQTGRAYRLPTESEWEYAARAGTTTPFSTGDCISSTQANFDDSNVAYGDCPQSGVYLGKTVEVKSYPANRFRLYDMHGNVYEWTQDCWHENYTRAPDNGEAWLEAEGGDCELRVLRGGAWLSDPRNLRSAYRIRDGAGSAFYDVGFRVARTL